MTVHVSSKPADGASRLPAAAWLVLGIVLVADIMDLLDSTITTIAAPTISSSLHGGPGLIKWLGASYALALGVLLVTGGRLGDKYGRRRIFLIGIAGFTAASLAASAAELAPAMTLIGLGMGATFSTIYDIAIGDIDPAEAGSASRSLSSIQQLANAIGAAVITTIYFGALADGPAHAMTLSLLTVIAIGVLSCPAIPLLPRHAQPAGPH